MHDKTIRRRRAVLALLVVISLILLTDYFGESSNSPLHTVQRGIVAVLSPVQDGASKVLSPVRDVTGWFSSTLRAKSKNAQLQQEVDTLTKEVNADKYDAKEYSEAAALLKLDNTANLKPDGLVAANVISADPVVWYESITVGAGSNAGVKQYDPVIGPGGLVGDVKAVTADTSVVTLLTSPTFAVGAMIENQSLDFGVLQPQVGTNTLLLSYLPSTAQISPSQEVVTSGFKDASEPSIESLYPPDIPIGQISSQNPQTSLYNDQPVQVTPAVDLTQLRTVQILTRPHA